MKNKYRFELYVIRGCAPKPIKNLTLFLNIELN